LEELHEADVLLHVVDAKSAYAAEHIDSVRRILRELEIDKPEILVFNKTDKMDDIFLEMLRADQPDAVFVSALDRKTLAPLLEKVQAYFWRRA
jgi:GTP-binding protein HflX